MTILPIAVRARIPLIIFAGEAPLNKAWYNQGIEQKPFVEACGADYRALHNPSTIIADVHHAFADALRKQKPIVVGVPFDLQQQEFQQTHQDASQQIGNNESQHPTSSELFTSPAPLAPCAQAISDAAAIIANARRPIVLAGLGAVDNDASQACVALAEHCGACLATTLPAKGLFHNQPFSLGVAGGYATEGAKAIFNEADLVIGVGARLASHTFDGGSLTPNAKVIHIDLDPQKVVQGRKVSDLKITSDACLGVEALSKKLAADALKTETTPHKSWRDDHMLKRAEAALKLPDTSMCETPDGQLHPMAVIKVLSELIPANCHIVNTSGHCAYYTAQMNKHPQSHYTVIRDFGAIGNGTSFAMGIATAHPERLVVLLDGDGSALMNIQELETMKRHGMNILTIVLNDGAYGSEVHKLRADGVTDAGSVFGRSDFAGIARGFGLVGKNFSSLEGSTSLENSTNPEDSTSMENLPNSMNEFLSNPRPTVWDINISDQVASPQILKAHKAVHS